MTKTAYLLFSFTEPRGLGEVWSGDPGIILARGPDIVRAPDVCFYAAGRLPEDPLARGFTELVPDLIIEIAAPEDRPGAIRRKTRQWLEAGARLVWNFYPESRRVVISQRGMPDRTLREGDVLSGEPVLPEFSVPVSAFFA